MKRNASETVTEAVHAMNKMAPPGDVTCVIILSATILLLKSSWTMKLLFKSSGTKISLQRQSKWPLKASLSLMLSKITPMLCQVAFMDRNVLKVNKNWILLALCV